MKQLASCESTLPGIGNVTRRASRASRLASPHRAGILPRRGWTLSSREWGRGDACLPTRAEQIYLDGLEDRVHRVALAGVAFAAFSEIGFGAT